MKIRTVGIAALVASAIAVANAAGLRINLTESAPLGLWVEQQIDQSSLKRGMRVIICPPEKPLVRLMLDEGYLTSGNCPKTQAAPLGKNVQALPGDLVQIQKGVLATVNGIPIPNSIARPNLPAWPDGEYLVQSGEVWVFSSYTAESFDSRYFGPVPLSNIRGEITPLAVMEKTR